MLNYNKILLVDDDTSFLNIYNKILKFNEYEVVICNNPELAENLVDVNETGIVITDTYASNEWIATDQKIEKANSRRYR